MESENRMREKKGEEGKTEGRREGNGEMKLIKR